MDNLREKLQQKQQEKQQEKQNDEIDRPAIREIDPRAVLAATLVIAIVAAGVGLVIYTRRRRTTFATRLQDALPDIDELRASIRKPLERVVKAL